MVDITPGYDFGVNEIPTAANLLKQATGMQLTGIGISELDSALVAIKSGDVSAVTEALLIGDTVGTIWMSPLGDMWVQEPSGPVILNRVHGGWETRRIYVGVDPGQVLDEAPGNMIQAANIRALYEDAGRTQKADGGTRASNATAFEQSDSGGYVNNRSGYHFGIIAHETGASEYVPVVFRGVVEHKSAWTSGAHRINEGEFMESYRLRQPSGTTAELMSGMSFHSDLAQWKHFGWAAHVSPASSKVSGAGPADNHDYAAYHMIYAFGGWMWGNEDNVTP